MIWVSIILGILSALPQLLSVIQEIWAAVHGHPAKLHAFGDLLTKHRAISGGSDEAAKAALHADLVAFHAEHVLGKSVA